MIKKLLLLVQFLIISNINSIAIAIDLKNLDEQISYSLGFMAAEHAKSNSPLGIKVNPNSFIQGFKDNFNNKQQLDPEQIIKSLNIIREKQLELQKKYMDKTTNPTMTVEPTIPASTSSTQPSTATPVVPQITNNPVTLGNPDINNFQDNNLLINTVQDINPKEISKNKLKKQTTEKNKSKDLTENEALKEIIISEELAKPKEFIKKIVKELDKNKSNQEPKKPILSDPNAANKQATNKTQEANPASNELAKLQELLQHQGSKKTTKESNKENKKEPKKTQDKVSNEINVVKNFLKINKKNKGINELKSGLQYQVLNAGNQSARSPLIHDKVKVHYRGTLVNGKEFDNSYNKNPAVFKLTSVIKGWQDALTLMKPNAKWKIFVPPQLAYGNKEIGAIPANSILIFEVELIEVNPS